MNFRISRGCSKERLKSPCFDGAVIVEATPLEFADQAFVEGIEVEESKEIDARGVLRLSVGVLKRNEPTDPEYRARQWRS